MDRHVQDNQRPLFGTGGPFGRWTPMANPEVTAIPLVRGTEGYLRWLETSTR